MRITKKYLKKIILQETKKLFEDSIADELDHLRNNIEDDKKHIDDLEKDIDDDRDEMKRAHKEEEKKNESRKLTYRQLRKMIQEEHQGYDAREDESLAALYGAGSEHEQDYKDRRDDAGFEERTGDPAPEDKVVHHYHHHDQGYDDREDEKLGAEHGAENSHEQDYKDRRDDAGFEVRQESRQRLALKRRISKMIRETLRKRR